MAATGTQSGVCHWRTSAFTGFTTIWPASACSCGGGSHRALYAECRALERRLCAGNTGYGYGTGSIPRPANSWVRNGRGQCATGRASPCERSGLQTAAGRYKPKSWNITLPVPRCVETTGGFCRRSAPHFTGDQHDTDDEQKRRDTKVNNRYVLFTPWIARGNRCQRALPPYIPETPVMKGRGREKFVLAYRNKKE